MRRGAVVAGEVAGAGRGGEEFVTRGEPYATAAAGASVPRAQQIVVGAFAVPPAHRHTAARLQHPGEWAAVATAICWTGSSLSFALATRRTSGIAVNQFRLWLALPCLLLLHQLVLGTWWPTLSGERAGQLVASGLAGLVLGDIGYFYALGVIGPRVSSVLMATWPAMATVLTWAWRDEAATWRMLIGIAMTMVGVMVVLLRQRDGSVWRSQLPGSTQRGGVPLAIVGALLGAFGQAVGSVLVAVAAVKAPDQVDGLPGLSAAVVRMAAASAGIGLVAVVRGRGLALRTVVGDRVALRGALTGTLFGPIVGVWLSMIALAHTRVGIAAALTATTPVFMMPVAKVAYGARIGVLGIVGTLLAVGGVAVLLQSE